MYRVLLADDEGIVIDSKQVITGGNFRKSADSGVCVYGAENEVAPGKYKVVIHHENGNITGIEYYYDYKTMEEATNAIKQLNIDYKNIDSKILLRKVVMKILSSLLCQVERIQVLDMSISGIMKRTEI